MIVVLSGSPNKNGNTNKIVNDLLDGINESIYYIDAYNEKIEPCIDCKYCFYKNGCSKIDKMIDVYDMIEKTDTLIIASPLYFAALSGELLNLISRFQTYFSKKYQRKEDIPHIKKAILIVTAGGYWENMFIGVKETFKILKNLFNINESMELFVPKCDNAKTLYQSEVKEKVIKLKEFILK